jgi:hypothetical protein
MHVLAGRDEKWTIPSVAYMLSELEGGLEEADKEAVESMCRPYFEKKPKNTRQRLLLNDLGLKINVSVRSYVGGRPQIVRTGFVRYLYKELTDNPAEKLSFWTSSSGFDAQYYEHCKGGEPNGKLIDLEHAIQQIGRRGGRTHCNI